MSEPTLDREHLLEVLREAGVAKPTDDQLSQTDLWNGISQNKRLPNDHLDMLKLLGAKYLTLKMIGRGGMGVVWKARHLTMNRLVAIKVSKVDEEDERFQREIEAVSNLKHPHIVQAYEVEFIQPRYFFVMEYLEGGSLRDRLGQSSLLPVQQLCHWMKQAAEGLEHARRNRFVHRDIKPDNLMLNKEQLKLTDFGLVRFLDPSKTAMTEPGETFGTCAYMPPEQAKDAHLADTRSDIYSLGCTFYHLLTGRLPFEKSNSAEMLLAHQLDHPRALRELRPDIPEPIEDIVRRMMKKQPRDRYQTPGELAAALAPFCADNPATFDSLTSPEADPLDNVNWDSTPSTLDPAEPSQEAAENTAPVSDCFAEFTPPAPKREPQAMEIVFSLVGMIALLGLLLYALMRPDKQQQVHVLGPERLSLDKPAVDSPVLHPKRVDSLVLDPLPPNTPRIAGKCRLSGTTQIAGLLLLLVRPIREHPPALWYGQDEIRTVDATEKSFSASCHFSERADQFEVVAVMCATEQQAQELRAREFQDQELRSFRQRAGYVFSKPVKVTFSSPSS